MALVDHIARLGKIARLVLIGRVLAGLTLLGFWLLWGSGEPDHGRVMIAAVTVWLGWTALLLVLVALRRPILDPWPLTLTALVDGTILAVLTGVYGRIEDPFLPWFVLTAVVVAAALPGRRATILAGVLCVQYLLGHAFGHPPTVPIEYYFVFVSALSILLVAVVLSRAMTNAERRRVEVESQATELEALNEQLAHTVADVRLGTRITELAHSTLDIDAIAPRLLEIIRQAFDMPTATLQVLDRTNRETIFPAPDVAARMRRAPGDEPYGCLDLVDHGQLIVQLCAEAESIDALPPDRVAALRNIGAEFAVAIENARLYRLTKRLAITDELTGLYNYRYMQQRLDEELGRAGRYGKRVSLLLLDVDGFKRVNDVYGHRTGDTVLAELAQVLRTAVREVDVVTRYGGEEFAVILPETDAAGAFIVAEKVREAVEGHRFADPDTEQDIRVTASIGLASYPVHAIGRDAMLQAADDALYQAKRAGKDRVRASRLRLSTADADDRLEEVAE